MEKYLACWSGRVIIIIISEKFLVGKGIPGLPFQTTNIPTNAHENFMMVFGLCALGGWMDGVMRWLVIFRGKLFRGEILRFSQVCRDIHKATIWCWDIRPFRGLLTRAAREEDGTVFHFCRFLITQPKELKDWPSRTTTLSWAPSVSAIFVVSPLVLTYPRVYNNYTGMEFQSGLKVT